MKDDYCNKNFTGEVFRNGEKIPRAKNIEEFLEYGRNEKPCLFVDTKLNETFYNFFAVEDPRRLAPKGYKVASADNWNGIIAECGIQDVEDAGVDEFDCLEEDYIADNEDCTNLEANKENFKFSDSIQKVASKGGTTEEGLKVLSKRNNLFLLFEKAIRLQSAWNSLLNTRLQVQQLH